MSSTTKEREGGHEVLGDRGRWYQLKQRSRYRDTLILVLFIGQREYLDRPPQRHLYKHFYI